MIVSGVSAQKLDLLLNWETFKSQQHLNRSRFNSLSSIEVNQMRPRCSEEEEVRREEGGERGERKEEAELYFSTLIPRFFTPLRLKFHHS